MGRQGKAGEAAAVLWADREGRPCYRLGRAPVELGTRRQLRADGLSVAGLAPVAWLRYSAYANGVCPLFDRRQARPVRALTERQRAALAAGRALAWTVVCAGCPARIPHTERRCADCDRRAWQEARERFVAMLARSRREAAAWAAEVLVDPQAVVLDTETTGLDGYAVQVAVLAVDGTVLLDTLVNPRKPIPAAATGIHGITDEAVRDAPTFAELVDRLGELLHGRRVVIYNASFDTAVLRRELDRHLRAVAPVEGLNSWDWHPGVKPWMDKLRAECAMEHYAEWYGDWNDYHHDFTWQPLGGGHDARGDCEAVLARLRQMATSPAADAASGDTNDPTASAVNATTNRMAS